MPIKSLDWSFVEIHEFLHDHPTEHLWCNAQASGKNYKLQGAASNLESQEWPLPLSTGIRQQAFSRPNATKYECKQSAMHTWVTVLHLESEQLGESTETTQ